jgi:pimeloyl-ACP methyl ester carboxylesterase
VLLSRPADPKDTESVIDYMVQMFGVIGSPGLSGDAAMNCASAWGAHPPRLHPAGTARQLLAVIASGDRRKLLRTIKAPTLVIHGAADPLVPLAAGRDTAQNIPARELLELIEGMGHDFPGSADAAPGAGALASIAGSTDAILTGRCNSRPNTSLC